MEDSIFLSVGRNSAKEDRVKIDRFDKSPEGSSTEGVMNRRVRDQIVDESNKFHILHKKMSQSSHQRTRNLST